MKILLIIIFTCVISYSQDRYDIFKDYLPKDHKDINEINIIAKSMFNSIPLSNLELYYYFIESLTIDATNNNNEMFREYISYLNFELNDNIIKKNNWYDYQKELINNSSLEEQTKIRAIGIFTTDSVESKITANPKKLSILPDSNKICFYKWVYYNHLPFLNYDFRTNYSSMVDEYEDNIVKELKESHRHILQYSKTGITQPILIDQFKEYWYIIDRKLKRDDNLYNYVIDYYLNYYSHSITDSKVIVGLSAGINSSCDFSFTRSTTTPLFINIEKEFNLIQYGISVAYLVYLKEERSIFSNISYEVGFSYGQISHKESLRNFENGFTEVVEDLIKNSDYRINFINSNFELKSLYTISLSVHTPLYYASPDYSINIGANLNYNFLFYDLNYTYNSSSVYTLIDMANKGSIGRSIITDQDSFSDVGKTQLFRISPLLICNYNITEQLSLQSKVGFNNYSLMISSSL